MFKIFNINSFFVFRRFIIVNDFFKFDDINKTYLKKNIYLFKYKLFQNKNHFINDFENKIIFNRLQYSFNCINDTIVQQILFQINKINNFYDVIIFAKKFISFFNRN